MRATLITFLASNLALGCGTVAGNPKKPKDQPPAGQIRYTLPAIDFDFDDATLVEDAAAGLSLAPVAAMPGGARDKTLFNDTARRLLRVVRQINAVTLRINAIVEAEAGVDPGQTLRFSGKGPDGKLAGKITEIAGGEFDYEAVLCHSGRPVRRFLWRGDGQAIELTQDLSAETASGEATFALVSRARVDRIEGGATLDLALSGLWENSEAAGGAGDGSGLVERTFVENTGDELRLRSVHDRFEGEASAALEGERYVVGRMTRRDDGRPAGAGLRAYEVDFAGWGKKIPRPACEGGAFDEEAADLWEPDGSGPEFCVGRRASGERFGSVEEFAAHVKTLEPIGLARKADLERVLMPEGLSCE